MPTNVPPTGDLSTEIEQVSTGKMLDSRPRERGRNVPPKHPGQALIEMVRARGARTVLLSDGWAIWNANASHPPKDSRDCLIAGHASEGEALAAYVEAVWEDYESATEELTRAFKSLLTGLQAVGLELIEDEYGLWTYALKSGERGNDVYSDEADVVAAGVRALLRRTGGAS